MKKLANRIEFVDMLKNLLVIEKGARDRYIEEGLSFENVELKAAFASIKKDEDRHIVMISELIDMLEY